MTTPAPASNAKAPASRRVLGVDDALLFFLERPPANKRYSPPMHPKQPIFDKLFQWLNSHASISPNWTVAEFGVGKTGFAGLYAEKFSRMVGIDIEDYSAYHPGVEFFLSRANKIPLPDNIVDLVVSHSAIEHLNSLPVSFSEINRITKTGGLLFLTVSPLYFSGYGSHINVAGKRLDNWEHLVKESPYYMTQNPMPDAKTSGHYLNKLTCQTFLQQVGKQPWTILKFDRRYETGPIPEQVDRSVASHLDLRTKSFLFLGQKHQVY